MKYSCPVIFLVLIISSATCTRREPPPTAFYYWKTSIGLDNADQDFLSRICPNQPLYVRLFDVDYRAGHGGPIPTGDLSWQDGPTDRSIIPVVFLTNRTFQHLQDSAVQGLAQKTRLRMVDKMTEIGRYAVQHLYRDAFEKSEDEEALRDSLCSIWIKKMPEIQFDCDWTPGTRERYFQFLREMKMLFPHQRISCTIRLHQYRDRKQTGVPPADRGVLMCYNTGDPKQPATRNAILDIGLVKGYLKAPPYPLPLDVALPLFSWGAWFRGHEFRGLLQGWDAATLADTALFYPIDAQHFQVRRDTVIEKDYLREGDEIRLDEADKADLLATAALLQAVIAPDGKVIFFDFQPGRTQRSTQLVRDCLSKF